MDDQLSDINNDLNSKLNQETFDETLSFCDSIVFVMDLYGFYTDKERLNK